MILSLPYTALRAFEVVVRRSNFSAAAEELGVSQSAISQHVKSLEEWLGQELLTRGARKSVPTREGEQLARAITEGLGRISDVCAELRDQKRADKSIIISCLPGFAYTWLFPRLLRFDFAHPHLSVSIVTDTGRHPFSGSDADVGIRYGFGDRLGFHVEQLMQERIFPVCAPSLLSEGTGLASINDLSRHTLLHDEHDDFRGSKPNWDFWARECDMVLPKPAEERQFGQSNMVIQAAVQGFGIALGREPLVIDALTEGRLVRPFAEIARSPLSYWLVHRRSAKESRKIDEFLCWIRAEVQDQPDIPPPVQASVSGL